MRKNKEKLIEAASEYCDKKLGEVAKISSNKFFENSEKSLIFLLIFLDFGREFSSNFSIFSVF